LGGAATGVRKPSANRHWIGKRRRLEAGFTQQAHRCCERQTPGNFTPEAVSKRMRARDPHIQASRVPVLMFQDSGSRLGVTI